MRLKVRHLLSCQWDNPPDSLLEVLRLTPRSGGGQFVRNWRIEIDADARFERGEDAFGNITHTVFVEGPVERFSILVEGEVETVNTDGIVAGAVERQPRALFLRETPSTAASPTLRDYAARTLDEAGGAPLAALHRLTSAFNTTFEIVPAATVAPGLAAAPVSPATTLDARRGSVQDLTHLMIACARALHCPARYVSGYLLEDAADGEGSEGGDPLHAWAEVFVAGLGWVGFDAALGLCTTERHIRVAVGSDAIDGATVRGARHGGGEALSANEVSVAQGRQMTEG